MWRHFLLLAVPVAITVTLFAGAAAAHGRFPFANQLVVDPGDAQHIVVRSTFGTLQTVDGGRTWSWICEGAIGYMSSEDPWLGVTSTGAILAWRNRPLASAAAISPPGSEGSPQSPQSGAVHAASTPPDRRVRISNASFPSLERENRWEQAAVRHDV